MRVGLTGGIGSGKSEVAKIFADHGAFIIDTDQLAREAVAPNSDGLLEIARIWPQVVRGGKNLSLRERSRLHNQMARVGLRGMHSVLPAGIFDSQ